MARRRRTAKHGDDLPVEGGATQAESTADRAGPRRTDSPQAGIARLGEVAGNQAVAGMLQRDDDGALDDGGGQKEGPQEAEFPSREERLDTDVAEPVKGGGGGSSAFGLQLRAIALAGLQGGDSKTTALVEGLCDAVGGGWSSWQATASVVGVSINGPVAVGGQLIGAPLQDQILANGSGVDREALSAVAKAAGEAHIKFTSGFSLVGLPLFPSFAAVPAPVAPPTPGVPTPLVATGLDTAAFSGLSQRASVGDKRKQQAVAAVLEALEKAIQIWLATTMLNILGTGPVPTFAPPYVPVGPVVGGIGTGPPGSLN